MTADLRDHALAYAARGWPAFPCKPQGKTPLTTHGFKEATTNPNLIERWWDRWPDANVGAATGKDMGAWVLDVDGEEGSRSLTALEAELGPLPETLEAQTGGGGRHLFFAWPDGRVIGNRTNVRPGIDVRGEGGYVVLPGSVHPSGRPYLWLTTADEPIVSAPKAWLDLVAPLPRNVPPWERVAPAQPPARRAAPVVGRTPIVERARLYLAEVEPAIQGNGGHNALLWAARALVVGFELDDATATSLLWSDYNPRCQPPWNPEDERDRRDLERKVGEARRTPADRKPGWLLDEFGLRTGAEAMAQIARGAESAALLLASAAKRSAGKPEPIPLEPPPPPPEPGARREFPVELFPEAIRDYVIAVSDAHNVDLSFAALPCLAVAGAAMGNAWRCELKRGFVVPPNLWVGLVSPSGTNKSGPLGEVSAPLRRPLKIEEVGDALNNPQSRMVVSDATLEAVVARLQDSRRGLLIYRDELAGWTKSFGQYKKGGGGDEQAWLEFWDAREYLVDRKTNNEQIKVDAAACTVLGGIQPKVLVECFDPIRFASGLVPRILIACPPRRTMFWRDEEVDPGASCRWADVVTWLRLTPFAGMETGTGRYLPRVVQPDPHAKVAFVDFFDALTAESEGVTDENAQACYSKARVQAARLMLIHHGLRIACGERDVDAPVTLASAEAGIAWARWCLEEQLRVYGFAAPMAREEHAKELAALIRERFPTPTATARQIMRLKTGRYTHASAARAAMTQLVELGYARWSDEKRGKVILTEESKA